MELINVSEENFKVLVLESKTPVLVDFWAAWCGPCRMVAPILHKLQDEYGDKIKIVKVDVDTNPKLAEQYRVMSIPTLIAFKDGKEVDKIIGAQGETKFKETIDKVIVS